MAGTPSKSDPRVIKDFGQPRKFLRDMRARIARNPKRRLETAARKSKRS
jgi:hypothetical protein